MDITLTGILERVFKIKCKKDSDSFTEHFRQELRKFHLTNGRPRVKVSNSSPSLRNGKNGRNVNRKAEAEYGLSE